MMSVVRGEIGFFASTMPARVAAPFCKWFLLLVLYGCCCAALWCAPVLAEESDPRLTLRGIDASDSSELVSEPAAESPWFILPAMINVHPKLESEELIEELFNPAMRLLAPGFRDVRTIASLRDEYILWTPDLGIGRVMSRYWAAYIHFGYSAGKVRTKSQDTSMLFVPLHTDFEIYRSAAYIGLCADIFPWGMPERREYHGLWDRLRNTRPSVGLRVTETYASYRAKAKAGFTDFTRFLNLELSDRWWVTTFNANLGADIPLSRRDALALNAGYNVACTQGFDFDGAAFTVGWKHYFK